MPDGRQPAPGGWARIVIETDDIESLAVALRDAGATFRNDIISGPGGRQVIVEDPSGNAIEVFQGGERRRTPIALVLERNASRSIED